RGAALRGPRAIGATPGARRSVSAGQDADLGSAPRHPAGARTRCGATADRDPSDARGPRRRQRAAARRPGRDAKLARAQRAAAERRALGHYLIDLLLARGEQDLARVAVGELLDTAPSDIRALLAQLELAFLVGRADEFGVALEQIARAMTDHELRAAVQSARG